MAPFPRRALAVACVLVVAVLGLSTPASGAEPSAPGTVSGTITTVDGLPFDRPVLVSLFSWDPGGSFYPTPQDTAFLDTGSDGTYTLQAPLPGFYTIRARPSGGSTYLTTWLGQSETSPTSTGGDDSFFVDETMAPQTGKDVTLRKAVRVSGVVRGTNGQPLRDVTVDARRWVDGRLETIPSTPGSITDSEGRYALGYASGTAASLVVTNRTGYRAWVLGGQHDTQTAANTIQLGAESVTQDITLTPDWSGVGGDGRVVRDEKCLVNALAGVADLDGLRLDVASRGVISPEGTSDALDDPMDPASPVPALVPYWSDTARPVTWGLLDDSTLCAIWQSPVDRTAYQAIVTADGDVTYGYGSIGPNLYVADTRAGWTEGTTDDATQYDFPKDGDDGFADGQPTALTSGPAGSATPGRYRFGSPGSCAPTSGPLPSPCPRGSCRTPTRARPSRSRPVSGPVTT